MSIDPLKQANAPARGKRPAYFDDPAADKLLSMLMATLQELAVTRERLDSIERLLEEKDVLSRADIEAFRPDRAAAAERGLAHRDLIARVLRAVEQEMASMQAEEQAPEELAEEFSRE